MDPVTASKADQQIDLKAPSSSASGPPHVSPFPHPTNATKPPKKPSLISWLLFGAGPGPGEAPYKWRKGKQEASGTEAPKTAIKCDMCAGIEGGPDCVRACPTGAAIRVSPEKFLTIARTDEPA